MTSLLSAKAITI